MLHSALARNFCWPCALSAVLGCGGAPEQERDASSEDWQVIAENEAAALLSVSGTSSDDVWMVGADDGSGPLVLHGNGVEWQREEVGVRADLWWVQALPGGSVYLSGSGGTVLERRAGAWVRMQTPVLEDATVFGVWSASENDVYAVGSAQGSRGFLWHFDGSTWRELPLPPDLHPDGDAPSLFKVWGASPSDVWVVGDRGMVLRGSAGAGFRRIASGSDEERLFTVHGAAGHVALVGGSANGWALEPQGDELVTISPPGAAPLQGVCVSERGDVWAVGVAGNVYTRDAGAAEWRDVFTGHPVQSLHAMWIDPQGGLWAVGGNVLTQALDHGVALHYAAR